MARKVFISFLGTGHFKANGSEREYSLTQYGFNDQTYDTSIVGLALKHFLKPDIVYFFGTMKSAWEDLYLKLGDINPSISINNEYANKLFELCNDANQSTPLNNELFENLVAALPNGSNIFPIKYGLNEQEIKENFEIFAKALATLKDGDEVYLDISNSFRSLPLFATTALSYIQDVSGKKIKLQGIYYGMFEAKTNGIVPIVDLSYINQLQDWIKGAHSLIHYGNGYLVSELMEKDNQKIVSDKISNFTDSLLMNYMHEVKTHKDILTSLQKEDDYTGPAKLILPTVFKNFTSAFSNLESISQYQLALAKWHFNKKLYALSYLALIESIVSYVCEKEGWLETNETNRKDAKVKLLKHDKYKAIKVIYAPANEARKSVAHIIENASQKAQENIEALRGYLEAFEQEINKK
ncbi:MAG TPA: TIGR02221 family CRISPR-associated protein [Chitinophagales bacterium]|nr:TIGR02221 family CRISPR-associated protein [Chitinophagales bacterium]